MHQSPTSGGVIVMPGLFLDIVAVIEERLTLCKVSADPCAGPASPLIAEGFRLFELYA